MKTTYTELNSHIEFLTAEVNNLKAAIEYTEQFLMDETPLVPQHLAEMKSEVVEMTEDLAGAKQYAEQLAAY